MQRPVFSALRSLLWARRLLPSVPLLVSATSELMWTRRTRFNWQEISAGKFSDVLLEILLLAPVSAHLQLEGTKERWTISF